MQSLLKLFLLLGLLFSGHSAQCARPKGDTPEFSRAAQALESGQFFISVTSLHLMGIDPITTIDSYISMRDGLITMQFSRDFPPELMQYLRTDLRVREATITPKETRRNGNRTFEIVIPRNNNSELRLLVTLLRGSDECFIRLKAIWGYYQIEADIIGCVSPPTD